MSRRRILHERKELPVRKSYKRERRVLFAAFAIFFLAVFALPVARVLNAPNADASGVRVSGAGRSDASRVLDAALFESATVRHAYTIARRMPGILNKLYCWCGCIDGGTHRSLLECFESRHAADCVICVSSAQIAWNLTAKGVNDPGTIQRELDRRFSPL